MRTVLLGVLSLSEVRMVRLCGPNLRRSRARCADTGDGAQVVLYRDACSASFRGQQTEAGQTWMLWTLLVADGDGYTGRVGCCCCFRGATSR